MNRTRAARIAGLWYLAMLASGPFGLLYVPSKIVVAGDAAATAAQVASHATLVRLGVSANLLCQLAFIFLVLALVRLFDGVHPGQSRLMKAFVLVAVPIAMLNEGFMLAALESATVPGLAVEARAALVGVLLHTHQQGVFIASIFWGLWLIPFGLLTIRSGFLPKVLGALLLVGGASYLVDSFVALLAPQHHAAVSSVLMVPLSVGELCMLGWLLVKGARSAPA